LLISGGLGAIAAVIGVAPRAEAADTDQEKEATKVVRDFFAAWSTRDPNQMASYVADDFQFRVTAAAPMLMGRDAFVDRVGKFMAGPIGKTITFLKHPVTESFAVDGPAGTAVLTKRTENRTVDGKMTPGTVAAMCWVVNGKIQAWYDFPLAAPRRPPA
jgi:ketosteroid isomerase-like protein